MQKKHELSTSSAKFWFKNPVNEKHLFAAFLVSLFDQSSGQCSNKLDFPYQLVNSTKNVGACLALQLPSNQNSSIPVILSYAVKLQDQIGKFLNDSRILILDYQDCCLIQVFEKFKAFKDNNVVLWPLQNAVDMNTQIEPSIVNQLEQDLQLSNSSSGFLDSFALIVSVIGLCIFCAILLAFIHHRFASKNNTVDTELTPIVPREP